MSRDSPNIVDLGQHRKTVARHALLHRIIRDHEPALRRFLRARLANHPDYEDLVQEIYMRLARQTNLDEKLSMGEAQTRSYLFSIATNLIRDRHRRKAIRRKAKWTLAAEEILKNPAPSPEDILISRQDLDAARKAILSLPANCRRAFVLSRFRNLSYRKIAEEMNISISMVEKHIMRALTDLRSAVSL